MTDAAPDPVVHVWSATARPVWSGDGDLHLTTARGPLRLDRLSDWQTAALHRLDDGATEAEMRGPDAGTDRRAWVRMTLDRLVTLGVLDRVVAGLVRLEVVGDTYRLRGRRADDSTVLRLSRFALLRADPGTGTGEPARLVLESPLLQCVAVVLDPRLAGVVGTFAQGQRSRDLVGSEGLDRDAVLAVVGALLAEGFLEPAEETSASRGRTVPDAEAFGDDSALAEWSFADALFHSRSRLGRHRDPYGAGYPFAGVREPLPAVKAPGPGPFVDLTVPDLAVLRRDDAPFTAVVEDRRSWRLPGPRAVTLDEVGEWLYRAARVRGRVRTAREPISNRPYPGGGSDYELEVYLASHRVDGLDRGLWHYDPLRHRLDHVAPWSPGVEAVVDDVCGKTPPARRADVVVVLTARMGRLTYKYQSIAYAIALKDVGVLFQNLYLVATAMGLAPCAIGGGHSDLFSLVSGVPAWAEPSVGEFMLNTRDPGEEASRPALPDRPQVD